MKKMFKYAIRTILAILGVSAFLVLVGEPTEELSMSYVIMMKAAALAVMLGAIKFWMLTLTERERRELDNEQV